MVALETGAYQGLSFLGMELAFLSVVLLPL